MSGIATVLGWIGFLTLVGWVVLRFTKKWMR
jgi:hypothetical protein